MPPKPKLPEGSAQDRPFMPTATKMANKSWVDFSPCIRDQIISEMVEVIAMPKMVLGEEKTETEAAELVLGSLGCQLRD